MSRWKTLLYLGGYDFWTGLLFFLLVCRIGEADQGLRLETEFKKQCRECHYEALNQWDSLKYRHFPYRREKCDVCHALKHKTFTTKVENICSICHNLASKKIMKKHASANLEGTRCITCHYVHASNEKGLLKDVVHAPFSLDMCVVCHDVNKENKIQPKEHIENICTVCHKDIKEQEKETIYGQHKMSDCTRCHNPHTTNREKLLNNNVTKTCLSCHEACPEHPFSQESLNSLKFSENIWGVNFKQKIDCTTCHDPHKVKSPALLKEEVGDENFCYQCHQKEE